MARRIFAVGFVTVSERKSEAGAVMPGSSQNEREEGEEEAEKIDSAAARTSGVPSKEPGRPEIFLEGGRALVVVPGLRCNDHDGVDEGGDEQKQDSRPAHVPRRQRAAHDLNLEEDPDENGARRHEPGPVESLPLSLFRSEEHTSERQSPCTLVCRLLLEKKKKKRPLPRRLPSLFGCSVQWRTSHVR